MAITKVSGHVIEPTTNIQAGIITATRFDGPIGSGTTDGNFSGIITAVNLNVTGVGTFNGIGVTSLNVSGVSTFSNTTESTSPTTGSVKLSGGLGVVKNIYTSGGAYVQGSAGLNVTHNITANGNIVGDNSTNITGIAGVTATTLTGTLQTAAQTNITSVGTLSSLNVTGNATIGGVLTYADVTNIDSLGIVTARTGIKVLAGGINAVGVVTATSFVGDGGSLTGIDATKIITGNTQVQTIDTGSDGHIKFTPEGTERVRIDSSALKFTSNVSSTPSASGNVHIYRHDNILKMCGGSGIQFEEGGFTRWKITSGALHPHGTTYNNLGNSTNRVGNLFIQTSVDLIDDAELRLGSSDDLKLWHDAGAHSYVRTTQTGQNLYLQTTDAQVLIGSPSAIGLYYDTGGAVTLRHNNNNKLATSATGISVTGEVAATQDYPDQRPTLDFNFAAVKKLDPRIKHLRSSHASYVNKDGIVEIVGDNTPRFDHDPATRECKGLLIEETRTNQMINSNDIAGATVYNGTITGNATTAPDGTTTADKFACNSSNAMHRVDLPFSSGQIASSQTYTFSVFVKANGYDKLHIRYGGYSADDHGRGYDLNDGSTFDGKFDGTGGLAGVTSSSIFPYPNGWYKCSFTFTTAANASTGTATIYYYVSNSESTTNFAGNGSSGMYFWGSQFEHGGFVTSYIPTSGFTETRGQDIVTIDKDDIDGIFNPTEGTIFYEASVTDLTNDNQPIVAFRNTLNTSEEYHAMGHAIGGSVGTVRAWSKDASANNVHLTSHSGLVAGNPYKHMYGYKYNDYSDAFTQGATSAQTNTTSGNHAMLTAGVINELRFGGYYSAPEGAYRLDAGHIKRFSYWPTKMSNTQIKTYVS